MKPQDRFEDIVKKDLDVRASDRTYDRLRDIVLDAHGRSLTNTSATTLSITGRTLMKNPFTRLAIAAAIVVAGMLGMYALTGSVDGASITLAQVRQAMAGIDWMQIINRNDGRQEIDWYSFAAKVHIGIDAAGRIIYSDFRTRQRLHWPPGSNAIYASSIDEAREFADGSTGPFDMVDKSLRLTQAEQNSTLTREPGTWQGQKVEVWTARWDLKNQPGATRTLIVYIDVARRLPIAATFDQSEAGGAARRDSNIEFRYPETGPADIYAVGAPRSAIIKPAPEE